VDAFMCYKQKCKVVSLNLAHPVHCRLVTKYQLQTPNNLDNVSNVKCRPQDT